MKLSTIRVIVGAVRFLVILLAACGSTAAPPIAPPKPPPAPPAAVSCADAGVLLRGAVQEPKKAGPAKEAVIASACMFDKWPRDVLECVGSQQDAQACLARLTGTQRAALDKKLLSWAEEYAESLLPKEDAPVPDVDEPPT